MQITRNKFEMWSHNLSVTWKAQRPSFDNNWPDGVRD